MATGFSWIRPPEELAKAIEQYGQKALVAVHAVAAYVGQGMQDGARQRAPWQDRTGNARSGLFFAVDGFGMEPMIGKVSAGAQQMMSDTVSVSGSATRLVLCFGHTVYYGKFLELAHGGRYAIVMSTIEANLPVLEGMLRDIFV